MQARVFEAGVCQPFRSGGITRAAKGAGGAKAYIVQQDDEHVGRALRRPQRLKLREAGIWVFGLNRRGQTWRKLTDKQKAELNEAGALKLMQANPTLIKRPVLETKKRVHVGFTAADYQQLFS